MTDEKSPMSVSARLKKLSDPMSENMSDKTRLDAFVKTGVDAVHEIERLENIAAALTERELRGLVDLYAKEIRCSIGTISAKVLLKKLYRMEHITEQLAEITEQQSTDLKD